MQYIDNYDDFDDFLDSFDNDKRINFENKKLIQNKGLESFYVNKYKQSKKSNDKTEIIGKIDVILLPNCSASKNIFDGYELDSFLSRMFDVSTINPLSETNVYYFYIGKNQNEKICCKSAKSRNGLKVEFENALCGIENETNIHKIKTNKYRLQEVDIKIYSKKSFNKIEICEIIQSHSNIEKITKNKLEAVKIINEQNELMREIYNIGTGSMIQKIAEEQNVDMNINIEKLVNDFNTKTFCIVLQVNPLEIKISRLFKI